jgi:hypothetical protein
MLIEKASYLTKYSTLAHTIFFYLKLIEKLTDGQKSSNFLLQASHSKMVLNQSGFFTEPWGVKKV